MRRTWGFLGLLALVIVLAARSLLDAQSFPLNAFDSGSTSTPSRAYRVDPQLGSYRIMSSNEGFASDGRLRWHWSGTLMHLTGINFRVGGGGSFQSAVGIGMDNPTSMLHVAGTLAVAETVTLGQSVTLQAGQILLPAGSATRPGIAGSAAGAGDDGISISNNQVFFVTGGSTQWVFASANLTPDLTNTGNFGSATARPLQIFAGVNGIDSTGPVHVAAAFHAQTSFALGTHMVTVANDANAGTANAEVLSGLRSLYLIDCNDPQGCALQLGTSSIVPGATTRIFNISTNSNVATIATVANVQHVFSLFTMATNHSIAFMFVGNRSGASAWVETNRNGRAP